MRETCRRRHGRHGKQGGAVVKSLLDRGHEVRAVTRGTDSAKARELENAGVTLVRASLGSNLSVESPSFPEASRRKSR